MSLSTEAIKLFTDSIAKLGLAALTDSQLEQFSRYYDLLVETNKITNLTAITEEKEVVTKHFVDSLACLKSGLFEPRSKVIDVGSGAGLPGLAVKIFKEDLEVTCLEATRKKVEFIEKVSGELELKNTRAVWGRAEEIAHAKNEREKYDLAVIRAVGSLATIVELTLPFIRIGGHLVALKGPEAHAEVQAAEKAIALTGGRLAEVQFIQLPFSKEQRNLVIIEKITSTPDKYPRRVGVPAKHPLSW